MSFMNPEKINAKLEKSYSTSEVKSKKKKISTNCLQNNCTALYLLANISKVQDIAKNDKSTQQLFQKKTYH